MSSILYLLSSFFIFAAYLAVCSPLQEKDDIATAAFTLAVFQIITSEILLGIFGLLTPSLVICSNIIIPCLIIRVRRNHLNLKNLRLTVPWQYFKNINIVFIWQMIIVSYGLIIFFGLLIPPYAWDSISYHLLSVFTWLKAGKLIMVQPLYDTSFFPMNGALMMLWVYLTSQNLHLINIVQLPFAFMLAFATYSLARKCNIASASKVIPIVLLTPVIMLLSSVEYVDIIFACFLIIGLNFIVGYLRAKTPVFIPLACIALSLAGGTKPGGFWLIIGALLFLCFLRAKKASIKYIFSGLMLVYISGGWWFIRNIILTGNPIFPYSLTIFGIRLLKGTTALDKVSPYSQWFVDTKWQWILYPLREKIRGNFTYSIENGFGMQFVLGLAALCYAIYLSIIKKDKLSFFVFLIFPVTICFWITAVTCSVPRYIISLCSITAIALIYVYDHLNNRQQKIMDIMITYSLFFSFLACMPILIPYEANVLNAYFKNHKLSAYDYYRWEYGSIAKAWEWLDKNIPSGSVIAYNHPELITPLYGEKLQNNIIHIIPYDYPNAGHDSPRTYSGWKNLLIKNNVSYFFAYIPYWNINTGYADFSWLQKHPEDFAVLRKWDFDTKHPVIIYKVR